MGVNNTHSQLTKSHWGLLIPPKTSDQNALWQQRITWECCAINQEQVISTASVASTAELNQEVIGPSLAPIGV